MIDSHAHLAPDEAAADLARARAVGVERVITVATSIEGCHAALALAAAHDGVSASLGLHPHDAASAGAAELAALDVLLAEPGVVAVGETGLDYFRDYAPREAQLRLFAAELALAVAHDLPVVIHSRAADADTIALLADHPGPVVLHCFSSPGLLEPALERGWYVSFAGNLTFPNAGALRDLAPLVPADRLLVETDSPYLAPQPLRGARNEPANVVHTLAALAAARAEEPDALAQRIDENAERLFAL